MINWRRNAVLSALPGCGPCASVYAVDEFWRRFRPPARGDDRRCFLLLLILTALFAPLLAPFDAENFFDYDRLNEGPSLIHWFGVDALGGIF